MTQSISRSILEAFQAAPIAVVVVAGIAASASAQPSLRILTNMPGGTGSSVSHAISADGTTVVGSAGTFEPGTWRAFRWNLDSNNVENLGIIPAGLSGTSAAWGVSSDGSAVVGQSIDNTSGGNTVTRVFRWTPETGMVQIPDLPGGEERMHGRGISGDGSIVVGRATGSGQNPAYRWTQETGVVSLGTFPGVPFVSSFARAISQDGATIVGMAQPNATWEAFRWTEQTGMIGLGFAGTAYSDATAVNADGSVIVGETRRLRFDGNLIVEAFRWTEQTGMVLLGSLPFTYSFSYASGVSGDGSIVVGNGLGGWVWTEAAGMVAIDDYLAQFGLSDGEYDIYRIDGISADGMTLVGTANDPQGFPVSWVATVPAPTSAIFIIPVTLGAIRRRR